MGHHPTVFWTWMSVTSAIYLLCLYASIRARLSRAHPAAALGMIATLYGAIPLSVTIKLNDFDSLAMLKLLAVCVPIAAVSCIPLFIFSYRSGKERKAARQQREDDAEQLLRRLGA